MDIEKRKKFNKKMMIVLIVLFTIIFGLIALINSGDKEPDSKIPTDQELVSYAQVVVNDYFDNPSYPSLTEDYIIVPPSDTNLRSKIKGDVVINSNKETFQIIIEFVDSNFEQYDLKYFSLGNDVIYDSE